MGTDLYCRCRCRCQCLREAVRPVASPSPSPTPLCTVSQLLAYLPQHESWHVLSHHPSSSTLARNMIKSLLSANRVTPAIFVVASYGCFLRATQCSPRPDGTTGDTTTACWSISISSHGEQGRLRRFSRAGTGVSRLSAEVTTSDHLVQHTPSWVSALRSRWDWHVLPPTQISYCLSDPSALWS
jgi:hypothetical protein